VKVGDLVRPHPGIRHPWTKQHPDPWLGVILELRKKSSAYGGHRQAAVVLWNHRGFHNELQMTYELEVINESQ
jgi:hypothetical protein